MTFKLYILHKLPTPYNDELFRALYADQEINLQVFHLWKGSDRRPWQSKLGDGYPNYYMNPKFGIDTYSLQQAWKDQHSLFMVGDWGHLPSIALILARIARKFPVALWTDTPQEMLPRPFFKRHLRSVFLKWLLNQVDIIFGSGIPARRALLSMGAPEEKIVDLQFVVDLDHPKTASKNGIVLQKAAELRKSVGCGECDLVFSIVGTIDLNKKAQHIGVQAFADCVKNSSRLVGLLIAGTGSDLGILKQLAIDLGISDQVNFLGWLEPEEIDAVYMATDVLVHPAYYDPFPLVVIEAMSWGIPIIGTSTSGSVEERVYHGKNGFVVPPNDTKSLTEAMLNFVNETKLLQEMSLAARKSGEEWPVTRATEIIRHRLQTFQNN